jgi:hypothetical protein
MPSDEARHFAVRLMTRGRARLENLGRKAVCFQQFAHAGFSRPARG